MAKILSKKKELRAKLLEQKKAHILLKREIVSIDKSSLRAVEIRKLLGVSTMQDILGEVYPLRVCKHCGLRATSLGDLWQFQVHPTSKYGYSNCCVNCARLKAIDKTTNIVGPYCLLVIQKTCEICKRKEVGIGSRSWFLKDASVCKSCLGTHEEAFGFPLARANPVPIEYLGVPIVSYRELADALGLPYYTMRRLLIQNKLKDITWRT